MIDEINSVLNILDSEKDPLLIELLKQKKETKAKIGKFEFDVNEVKPAKNRIDKVLYYAKEEFLSNNTKYDKIQSILKNFSCQNCPFSVDKFIPNNGYSHGGYSVKWRDENRLGCQRCDQKKDKLIDYAYNLDLSVEQQFKQVVTNEVIDTFTLIFIIEKKLKQLKTK
jgi:hypothetical protein